MESEAYVQAYKDLEAKVGDKDIALAILSHVAKDRRTADINDAKGIAPPAPRRSRMDPNGPPTMNQQGLMRRLGLTIPATAGEASKLLDENVPKLRR